MKHTKVILRLDPTAWGKLCDLGKKLGTSTAPETLQVLTELVYHWDNEGYIDVGGRATLREAASVTARNPHPPIQVDESALLNVRERLWGTHGGESE